MLSNPILFVATLKILLQIWCEKIESLDTLIIALAKELLTLYLSRYILLIPKQWRTACQLPFY